MKRYLTGDSRRWPGRFREKFIIELALVVARRELDARALVISSIMHREQRATWLVGVMRRHLGIFVILSICALFRPLPLATASRRDIPVRSDASLLALLALASVHFAREATDRIGRIDGVAITLLYMALLYYASSAKPAPRRTAAAKSKTQKWPRMTHGGVNVELARELIL